MDTLWQDVRYGLRMLGRSPGFTAVAVLTLGLGIGANSAIFSVVDAVLLRPLPYPEPERIVWLSEVQEGLPGFPFSIAEFLLFRESNRALDHVAALRVQGYNLTGAGAPERIRGVVITPSLFPALGVQPLLGRLLVAGQDDVAGAPRVAVLSHAFWQQQFGGDAGAVGRTIRLNDENVTVVGVLPARFAFLGARDVWVNPADVVPEVFPNFRRDPGSDQSMHYLLLVGRLKPGVPLEQAQADLDPIALRLARQRDSDHRVRLASLHEQATGGVRPTLLVLLAAVGFVLLIACANVANLLLARATSRAREVAVRSALGASRWRLVRQLLTEGLLLAVLGGAVGLLLASWGMEVLRGLGPQELPRANGIRVDDAVLAFTLGVSILTSLLFGLAPALHAARSEARALAEGGAGGRASARGRLRGALVAAEMALSVLLLVGAGLLLRSFVRLLDVEPGFNPRGLVTVQIAFSSPRYVEPGRRAAFVRDLVPRLEALPGVEGVALANDLPLEGRDTTIYPAIEGRPGVGSEELILTGLHAVNPGYFRAMQIPLLRGRGFEDGDAGGAPRVALINRTAAERFWPAEDPLGRRLRQSDSESEPWLTVIGVAGDVKHDGLGEPPAPDVYVPFAQNAWAYAALALRAPADAEGLARLVRAEIQALDPDQPVFSVRTMEAVLGETLASRRFTLGMIGLFAALALALAAVGLYGVMAYLVTQRTREIGVRMALGARRSDILRLIVGQGMRLTAAGVALGLAGALGLTRFLSGLLFGVGPADAPTFAGVTAVLLLAALAACWLPARRAARVDPLTGLRHE